MFHPPRLPPPPSPAYEAPGRSLTLHADHAQVLARFAEHPQIRLVQVEGTPPDKCTVEFLLPSLVPLGDDGCAEFFLPLDYPRRPPFCRMITPVFHPNIDPQKICIGDHWSAGQSLAEMIVRVGEMLCFQSYNCKSPLNAKAAAWAELNLSQLPLLRADLSAAW